MKTKPEYQLGNRQFFIAIFLIGLTCLMYELIQVRMLSFFLGGISNFLAIPLALFGLALGSMFCHFVYKGDPHKLIAWLTMAIFPLFALAFLVFFAVANTFFNEIHVALQNPYRDSAKLISYSLIFLPPYIAFGALLASFFEIGADKIGRLYFYDLVGAGLGCLLTPVLFTYTDLSPVILILLFAALLLILNGKIAHKMTVVSVAVVLFATLFALASNGSIFKEKPDAGRLARTIVRLNPKSGAREEAVRWNSLARTSLIRTRVNDNRSQQSRFAIVQDDGISNVHVRRYDPIERKEPALEASNQHSYPFILGHRPNNILVMFAGVARDMVILDLFADRKAKITGVELNDVVVGLARHPVMFPMNLHNFLNRRMISLVAKEGRDFLNTSNEKYDFIYLATNGSIHATRTGHSRKYLDTYEAMEAYLDHLTDDGIMVFTNQPIQWKIQAFKKIFHERGIPGFEKALHVMGRAQRLETDTMVFRPRGLTRADVDIVQARALRRDPYMKRLYSPFHEGGLARITDAVKAPIDKLDIIYDDRPFIRKVNFKEFTLFPSKKQMKSQIFSSSWIKIFTVILFGFVSLLVVLAARFLGGKSGRVPVPWLLYFLVSGISYMCVELGLIAKSELFLGNPLYAVAIILACFLAFNGVGAFLQDKYKVLRGLRTMLIYGIVSVIWGIVSVQLCNNYLLSLHMVLKVIALAICVFPVATVLGMYYPFGVATLVADGKRSTVPMTYCLATLSSVLGSSWAMTGITNTGFSTMIIIGGIGYVLVAFIYVLTRKLSSAS